MKINLFLSNIYNFHSGYDKYDSNVINKFEFCTSLKYFQLLFSGKIGDIIWNNNH